MPSALDRFSTFKKPKFAQRRLRWAVPPPRHRASERGALLPELSNSPDSLAQKVTKKTKSQIKLITDDGGKGLLPFAVRGEPY